MAAPLSMRDDIRKFEQIGTFPVAIPGGITEAATFHQSLGGARKAARLRYLRRRWVARVQGLPKVRVLNHDAPDHTCGLGAVTIDGIGADALTAFLERAYRIHVRPRVVDGEFACVRIAPNVFTTVEEVDLLAAALEHAAVRGIA
jgi:selenocysteine lyase/cysteine desulfurase